MLLVVGMVDLGWVLNQRDRLVVAADSAVEVVVKMGCFVAVVNSVKMGCFVVNSVKMGCFVVVVVAVVNSVKMGWFVVVVVNSVKMGWFVAAVDRIVVVVNRDFVVGNLVAVES